jgi:hypothetical protein
MSDEVIAVIQSSLGHTLLTSNRSHDMAEQSISIQRQHHLKERAADEFKQFLVIFLYLWVVFGVMSIHKSFILSQRHLNYGEHALAIINAFVFAKVLLVAEHFKLGTRFGDKPLIYPVLHKSFLFTAVLIGFHFIEIALVGLWHGNTITSSLLAEGLGNLKSILSVGMMSFVLLLPFFLFRELGRVIGHKELWDLILRYRESDPRLTWLGKALDDSGSPSAARSGELPPSPRILRSGRKHAIDGLSSLICRR